MLGGLCGGDGFAGWAALGEDRGQKVGSQAGTINSTKIGRMGRKAQAFYLAVVIK